jgi:N12 class adenine-specific DNA methylase
LASKFQFITELYSRTLTRLTGDYESWTGFLRSACYNYKCPFDEQVLIYAQRPDATAVLELEKWNRQFGRWVNAGATGIAVIDEARGKGRLKHYFDITDTHAARISRPVPIWSMEPAYTEPVIETLEATFGTLAENDNLPDAILSASRNAVADNMQDYLQDLLDCRGGSMLEELDALNVEVTYRRALQSSVAYMLMTRLSLPTMAYLLPEDFEGIYSFDTPSTINALGIATSDIAEMGLREISRTVMQARREQNFAKDAQIGYDVGKGQNSGETERSVEHGSDIQDAGGLSPAEPAAAPRGGGAPGQVRGVEKAVHQEAPQGAVYKSQDQRSVGGTSGGDRDGGGEDGDAAGGADGAERGRDGEAESRRSPALDGADEQPEAQRGGNGAERPDLQLNSTGENAGSVELPALLDEHLIEAILLDDGGRKHTRQEIFAYFQDNRDIATRTEFLKNSYNDIWVEVLTGADKVRVGYHAEKDGLLMWEGSYLSRTAESVFSWGVVTEMTENLIERGAYKIKLGLQNAPVMAEQMSLFGMNGGTAVYEVPETQRTGELFPTRTVPQAVIDQTMYTAGNSRGSAERIAVFFMRQRPEAECIAFLRREFGTENGRGIEYEGKKYAVWFMEDGIHLAQGDSVRTGHCRTTVTWERASVRILEFLEAGTYLSAPELEQAQDKVLLEMGDALLMTARDLAQEGRAQGLFPQTLAIHDQRKGYPKLDEDMVAFAKSEGGLAALAEEYHAFLSAYEQDRSIMRFRLSEYSTHRIGVVLDGIDLPERSFSVQPDFLRRCKMFITQDEIDQFFLAESVDSRLDVYAFFCYPHTKEEQQKFIKSRFGEYSGGRDGYDYTKTYKGLTYQREYAGKQYDEVKLSIPNVVKEYERLIAQKRFPGEDAIAAIPQYERRQLARTVYFGFSDAPDDMPRPYPKGTDYYDAVPVIEEQLADKAKAAEMLEALTSYLDGMDEGDRHYDSCQQAREQLSEYVNGTFSLFNQRHDSGLRQAERGATPITPTGEVGVTEEPAQEQEISPLPQIQQREEEAPQGQAAMPPVPHLPRKKERMEAAAPLFAGGVNYRITDDALGAAPPSQRYANNVAAIRLLKRVEAENRAATPEEQEVLAKYVGWGGLADCFDPKNSRYEELKGLLSETEYAAARESTLTAFYTPPVVIRSIYAALGQMGFRQGNVLEPACGVGHFLGMLPEGMAESKVYGVELDDVSGRIARQLYPRSSISVRGYEKMDFPDNFFDVAVGNVPFGQFKVQDRRYDRLNLSIHEYFFAKTLDKVRPGGVVAFVTSSYTMDKRTGNVRKYIAQRAELLGAIRLPNDTFKAAAGTEVVSDILFLQKRDRMVDIEPEWVQLGTNDDGITMNRYFIDHPDMVLGEMKMVSGPYGPEPTCVPFPEQPLDSLLANAVQNIHGEINAYDRAEELEGEDQSIAADPTVRNFSYTLVNDKLYYREDSRMNPVEASKTAESRIRGMIGLRDCVRTLLEYQTEDYPDDMIRQQQAKLNDLYDRFTHDYGLINSRGNAIVFDQDSSYFLLCSLEVLDEEGGLKRKADLFTKRTIRSHRPAERVDTAVEALALSIGEKARVDMVYMGKLTGKDEDTLFADLQGVVFLNPDYGERGGEKYLPADEYLSGNVRRKLAEVRAKTETEPQYLPNVEALEKVQPVDLTASEISVRLGATWLDPAYIRQFIFETLDTSRRARWDIKVHYSRITGEWRIEGKSKDSYNVKAYSTYGTSRASAYDIIESSLNLKDVRIFDYQYDTDGRRVAVLNKKETAIAQGKQELLKEAFAEWIWKDPERREKICKAYNILFNSNRPREYDGSHINFSGMNPEITLRKHQVNAIAHILYGGNTLLAHVVGAGKTFEMVAAAMESKRLGLCQKSLFVVPNHLTEQWASEFLQLYPAANVLVATKKDFETKNRKRFCGRIATGDYDAVIIGHSQFEKIPVSIQRQRAILEQQMDEIILGIREAKADKAENFTIKQMEKTRKGLQNKLDKLNDQSRKDDVVTFEELGVDRLFIDESHYYKNLFLCTKMRNVSGIAQTEAQKSSDLFMKCRYLDEITGGRGVVFATGTPISNSMVELYTIQRYLQMGALQEQGFQHFDAWAANYGETVTAIELAPEGYTLVGR